MKSSALAAAVRQPSEEEGDSLGRARAVNFVSAVSYLDILILSYNALA